MEVSVQGEVATKVKLRFRLDVQLTAVGILDSQLHCYQECKWNTDVYVRAWRQHSILVKNV